MKVILILIVILLCLVIAACGYVYNNLNYDKAPIRSIYKAGFKEKQVTLDDGTILNYGEGGINNEPVLLLIHGQSVKWQDYGKVLPQLAKHYHVYAIDCHGHGKSSKNQEKYTAQAMGKDFVWFIKNIIKQPVIVSGHSSGGLLTAWLAANLPENVRGIVLEDPPFFSTEASRCKKTFAWVDGFEPIHRFLQQSEEKDYVLFYLKNTYCKNFFGDSWSNIEKYATKYRKKHPNERLKIFFLPPAINRIWELITNPYDLKFGDTFYDCSWFENFDQGETLSRINCPSVLIHTSWKYDKNGILLAAMDDKDANRAHLLIKNNELIDVKSGHDFHYEKPKEFTKIMIDFLNRMQ